MQSSGNEKETFIPGLRLKIPMVQNQNPVSTLYENCSRCGLKSPEFTFPTVDEELSKNKQQFKCTLKICDTEIASGSGSSKKEARTDAARKGLEKLQGREESNDAKSDSLSKSDGSFPSKMFQLPYKTDIMY